MSVFNETYAKDSKAHLIKSSTDAYVKFFRWAIDRLQGRDGIVCFVSNNSFVDQIAFDGMRKHLLQDLRKFIILICMAMCAKIRNFQVQHIMSLVSR